MHVDIGGWSPRGAAIAAIAGALLGLALTPFMAAVWVYDDDKAWADATRLERAVGPTLEDRGLLDFGGEDVPYEVYGKPFFLVYALMLPAVYAAHRASSGRRSLFEYWSWRVLLGATIAGAAGDFLAYWGASLPGIAADIVSVPGFMVEFLAMPIIVLAAAVFGIAALRAGALPRWACALLIAAPATAIGTSLLVTNYVPNAVIVPVSVTWGIIATGLWLTPGTAPSAANADAHPEATPA